jgi:putative aldouronate transport system substrate-binding protein
MKTALGAMRDAFAAGYIDPEFIVKDSGAVSQDVIAGTAGIHFGEWWVLGWPLPDGIKLGQDWKAYPILYAESAPEQKVGARARLDARYVVRKGYEHPEALVKMYNLFQERVMSMNYDTTIYKTDEVYDFEGLTAIYAVIGHDRNMRNHIVVTEALEKGDTGLLENIDQENLYNRAARYLEMADEMRALDNFDGVDADIVNAYADAFNGYRGFIGPDSVYGITKYYGDNDLFNVDVYYGTDTPGMTDYSAQLKSNAEEMILNIISGAEDLDSFDGFVANWKALGGDQITEEVNAWYAAMN